VKNAAEAAFVGWGQHNQPIYVVFQNSIGDKVILMLLKKRCVHYFTAGA
jgi:hypothetical protein